MIADLPLMAEVEIGDTPGWVAIASIGGTGILIDTEEWPAFMQLVKEIDEIKGAQCG